MAVKYRNILFILLLNSIMVACSSTVPTWRNRTLTAVEELANIEASELYPYEYRSLLETFEHGEAVYQVRKDDKSADDFFRLALQKAEILRSAVVQEKKLRAIEKRRIASELAAKAEYERLMNEAAAAEERLKAKQLEEKIRSPQRKIRETPVVLPNTYTVRRGETLPQISARTEIYNDSTLWPIIYRANRDQIRDPKRLWPGQIFVIPRNFSQIEAHEARRYSNKK